MAFHVAFLKRLLTSGSISFNGDYPPGITDNLIQRYMEYIPDYLKPFIIHKDYFPELIEDSWFTLIPQHILLEINLKY